MMAHTPPASDGGWEAAGIGGEVMTGPYTYDKGDPHMLVNDPDTIFDCYYIFDANGNCVAIVPDDPYLGPSVLDNVKLFAAAPRLLAALEEIEFTARYETQIPGYILIPESIMPEIRAALAAVRGEE